jgi:hypothetical protein
MWILWTLACHLQFVLPDVLIYSVQYYLIVIHESMKKKKRGREMKVCKYQ